MIKIGQMFYWFKIISGSLILSLDTSKKENTIINVIINGKYSVVFKGWAVYELNFIDGKLYEIDKNMVDIYKPTKEKGIFKKTDTKEIANSIIKIKDEHDIIIDIDNCYIVEDWIHGNRVIKL